MSDYQFITERGVIVPDSRERVIVDRALTQDEQDRTTAYLGSKR